MYTDSPTSTEKEPNNKLRYLRTLRTTFFKKNLKALGTRERERERERERLILNFIDNLGNPRTWESQSLSRETDQSFLL